MSVAMSVQSICFWVGSIHRSVSASLPPDALWDFGQGKLIVVGENATAGIFATYPSKHLTVVNGFFDQVRTVLSTPTIWVQKQAQSYQNSKEII